jgi:ParB family chromosome partitioning protein
MPRKTQTAGSLALASFENIFNTSAVPTGDEQITEIPLTELHPPENHPFQVNNDAAMQILVESVQQYGVREPGLARKRAGGGYELLCGNRRKMACEIAGIPTLPVIVRELDDDSAALAMVDSNLQQREKLLYSEKAWAYLIKMDALNHNGVKGEQHSFEIMVAQTGESKNQIFRLIRLTELITALIDMVDKKQLAFNPAVELSYLSVAEQNAVAEAMAKYEIKLSLSQAVRLKKLKKAGELAIEMIDGILSEAKKPPKGEPTGSARYRRFFPPDYSPKQIDEVITELLTDWKARAAV